MKFKQAREIPNLPEGEHFDANTPGLSIIKRESGNHSWTLVYRINGKQKRWTIGRYPRISLKEARRRVRTRSDDPVGDKKKLRIEEAEKANVVSFEQLCARYIKEHAEQNQRFWKQTRSALKHPRFNSWRKTPVTEITRRDVKQLLAKIPGSGGLANQVRANLHAIFNFALDEDILEIINPVTRTKRRSVQSRDRVLTDDEIRSVWQVPLFRMILLTGQRPDNVKKICRSEINENVWTIPSKKFKLKKIHVAALVPTAIKTLQELPKRGEDRYFTPHECLGLIALLDELGVPDSKPKDLQRTCRTRLSMLNVIPSTAEIIQGHSQGIRSVYDRHDYFSQKYDAMQKLELDLIRIIEGEASKVIKFSKAT